MTECPECGHEKFSMLVEVVHFGPVKEYDDGAMEFVAEQVGEIADVATDDQGRDVVLCTKCHTKYAMDDDGLIPLDDD